MDDNLYIINNNQYLKLCYDMYICTNKCLQASNEMRCDYIINEINQEMNRYITKLKYRQRSLTNV